MVTPCLDFLRNCFAKWRHHFTFPPAVYEYSNVSTFPASTCDYLTDSDHPSECEVESLCGFDLHFPDDQ